jgi:PAS domain S-box-containing protein/putative nucleotidyltransferase with HDIG domain
MRDLSDKLTNENAELRNEIEFLNHKVRQMEEAELSRNQLLDELQETQELFNQFMEHSPIHIFFKDDRMRSIRLSRNYEQMLGRPIHDLLGKTMDDIFPSDLAKSMISDDSHILNSGKALIINEELNGRAYITYKFPIHYKGKRRFLAGYTIDITDQKRAEDALIKSEEKFRKAFYICPEPVSINRFDDGTFIMVNQAFTRVTGFTAGEIIGRTSLECNIWNKIEDRQRLFEELKEKGEVIGFEVQFCSKDGGILHGLASTSLIEIHGVQCFLNIVRDITKHIQIEKELKESLKQVRQAIGTTIQVLVSAVEEKDRYTAGHQRRTTDLARSIATELGMSRDRIEGLRLAGIVHDIGKLSVPSEILNKPGILSSLELALIKEHAKIGYDLLKKVKSPWPLADIVHQHHERIDGSGYPQMLRGEEILMEAKILAVADVLEAMSSHRPYRPAPGIDAGLEEIENNKGRMYDADVADACLRLFREKGYQFR